MRFSCFALLIALLGGCGSITPTIQPIAEPEATGFPSIAARTNGLDLRDGFFPLYWDAREGKVWLEIPALDKDFLYVHSLVAGLGSNDVGLDRSQLGAERIVRFERVGPRVLLVRPNLRFRATTDNPAERIAVEEAFAEGVEWGFDIAAESDGRLLVDATNFIVRDVHGVARALQNADQGSFSLDPRRSAPVPDVLKVFPTNTEMEARLTFATEDPGGYVLQTAADPYSVTVRVRHSFIELPQSGYQPRAFDPRSGYFPMSYADYGVPIGEDITRRFITRHRLECAEILGADGLCTPVKPIIYYLDPGTPEPVQSALLDGARWWTDAFEAAGFRDAYRVEVRPEHIDPLDARYSTIQWVHRATRGWSYGSSVTDPRTGEILKGHVLLGSLRVRQDYLIAEGLLAPYHGSNAQGMDPQNDPMLAMALARLRQLSAHEVGHTLGLAHNFVASADGRTSVMDYPAPLALTTNSGSIDVSGAYAVGIGAWDIQAIRYGYAQGAATPASILAENQVRELRYLTDADARPPGSVSPTAILWDNGSNAVSALQQEMDVRREALAGFNEAAIRQGRPMATLEEVLVPLYLRHRYQIEGTTKLIGGLNYAYTVRGDSQPAQIPVPGSLQFAAVDALMATLSPEALALPDVAIETVPPRPPGYYNGRELFDSRTHPTFDAYAPAEAIIGLVFDLILNTQRVERLIQQHDFNPSLPGYIDILDVVTSGIRALNASSSYEEGLRRAVLTGWVDALLSQAADSDAGPMVNARTEAYLATLNEQLSDRPGSGEDAMHSSWLSGQIGRWLERPFDPDHLQRSDLQTPPGSPIGQPGFQRRHLQRRSFIIQWMPEGSSCGHQHPQ